VGLCLIFLAVIVSYNFSCVRPINKPVHRLVHTKFDRITFIASLAHQTWQIEEAPPSGVYQSAIRHGELGIFGSNHQYRHHKTHTTLQLIGERTLNRFDMHDVEDGCI